MKTIFCILLFFTSLAASAQEVDSRTIPDLVPIIGTATYDQFFAVSKCLNTGIPADTVARDAATGTYTLVYSKHNVKVLRMNERQYQEYLARIQSHPWIIDAGVDKSTIKISDRKSY